MTTFEGRFIGVVTLVNFKLLMFLERLVTAFKVAHILLLLIFMLALDVFLQV